MGRLRIHVDNAARQRAYRRRRAAELKRLRAVAAKVKRGRVRASA